MTLTPRVFYLLITGLILGVEILIARFATGFVRGSMGDILVIALLYFLFRSSGKGRPFVTALCATALGFVIEGLQYLQLVAYFGLPKGSVLAIVLGSTFSAADLAMYLIGGLVAYGVDRYAVLPRWSRSD